MKNKGLVSVVSLLLLIFMLTACSPAQAASVKSVATVMTAEANISMSEDAGNPPVNDSVQTVTFTFSEPLNPGTIATAVTLYQMDTGGNPVKQKCVAKINPDNPNLLDINTANVEKFAEGQEYKIVVSNALKSTTGLALEKDFTGYFATNYTLNLAGNTALKNTRSQIVIISDIHLGVDDAFAETKQNRPALVNFLVQIKNSPNVAELVIAGDLLDGWFVPMDYVLPDSQSTFFDSVGANNQDVMDAINAIIAAGQIKVTYVPGNHDLLLTEADVERILPGINQKRGDVQGLGEYITGANSEIVFEHGHKYNIFCAPDQISNRDITKNNSSVLPPGYFFTRIATSSDIEGFPKSSNVFVDVTADKNNLSQYGYYIYNQSWKGLLSGLPVNEKFSDKAIKTNIDGYTQDYAINDLIPYQNSPGGLIDVNLYKGLQDNWDERQTLNGVKVKTSAVEAIEKANNFDFTDVQAKLQYFDKDATKRIVVFGHTHGAIILPGTNLSGEKTIYANAGTWIDNAEGYPTMTFVVITLPQPGCAVEIVNLYKYSLDDSITQWGQAQAITN
jgi:UDP-2,3-diacylglucosamine pyrophosphatase LpxH